MRPVRRALMLAAVTLLVLGVVVLGVLVVAAAALPLTLAIGVLVFALVVGLGSRTAQRSERRHGAARTVVGRGDVRRSGAVASSSGGREPQWVTQWESGPPVSAVPVVRGRLATVFGEWDLTPETSEAILLVVTELVSNAVEHAQPPVRLIVRFHVGSVRVEAYDAAPEPPQVQPHDPWRARGRGLQMIEALSTQWGWADTSEGKVVWAEVLTRCPD